MQCPKCQQDNRQGARFCASCGGSLGSAISWNRGVAVLGGAVILAYLVIAIVFGWKHVNGEGISWGKVLMVVVTTTVAVPVGLVAWYILFATVDKVHDRVMDECKDERGGHKE